MTDIPQHGNADPFYELAESTATTIGNEFLAAVVKNLHGIMPVSLCFIAGRTEEDQERVRGLYSWRDGVLGSQLQYDLEGTPCKPVYDNQVILVPEELAQKFPKEPPHRQSYCGVPIRDNTNFVIGHFAVIANEPVDQLERIEGIVRIFGMRIEAELQRLASDEKRERLIERLHRQQVAALQSNNFMSQVLAMVAHDLRNPLSAIIGRAESIDSVLKIAEQAPAQDSLNGTKERVAKFSDSILSAAVRMERMIADLLETARKETMSFTLRPEQIALKDAVQDAVQLSLEAAARKNIQIREDYGESIFVFADEDRLVQAVCNLISNAIKYSPANTFVRVSTRCDAEQDFNEVIVADEGAGMTEEDLARGFQPFQTLSARPTMGETSTGLGLTIVKSIVQAHGGSIVAQSDGKDKGTTMRIKLPPRKSESEAEFS